MVAAAAGADCKPNTVGKSEAARVVAGQGHAAGRNRVFVAFLAQAETDGSP